MNLPQWITVIAGSLTVLVWLYWAAAMLWIARADLWADTPWWLRWADKLPSRYND